MTGIILYTIISYAEDKIILNCLKKTTISKEEDELISQMDRILCDLSSDYKLVIDNTDFIVVDTFINNMGPFTIHKDSYKELQKFLVIQ